MKKYTDWQKYVKEQTEKLNRMRPAEEAPRTNVPEIDGDRFTIRKKETLPSAPPETRDSGARPGARPLPSDTRKPFSQAVPQQSADESGEPATPITSPFVSVQDIWKSAEKTTRKKPAEHRQDSADPGFKARAARVPEVTRAKKPDPVPDPRAQAAREESRDEILERLMNPTITLEEAAKIMGVCKATVRRYTAMGILPHYRTPGNQRRFKLNDIISFLENQRR
jgi:excisionase family DNA binding protein